ncbi:uncharacterized protein J8A68_001767 [[Candida] subhashii]|uniref:Uncharacterized protein n=1 Tax=[Candida] subhashii TaxID=561895 RepID=A0A8J5QHA9_9ASCO|nr:uncharacterized protein J8A68_001767 [[Candida] subhashii]KAG7664671.1 hypothetical protein J8A68_001767 [[Candida] subhashii]
MSHTKSDENEWSFTLYDESLAVLETSRTTEDRTSSKSSQENENDIEPKPKVNQYNPFILTKMNYFKKKNTTNTARIYNKVKRVSSKQILSSYRASSEDQFRWTKTLKWLQRRGFPSELILDNGIFARLNINKEDTMMSRSSSGWFVLKPKQDNKK